MANGSEIGCYHIYFALKLTKGNNLCKTNLINKYFRNRCEDKGKPDKTSIRYGMKLCHHGTRNRHGMSTHLRRVRTDPNLPKCTMCVCAVYVPLPDNNCRLHIPIRTRTILCISESGLSTQALQQNTWFGKRLLTAVRKLCTWKRPCNVRIGQINTFLGSRNC